MSFSFSACKIKITHAEASATRRIGPPCSQPSFSLPGPPVAWADQRPLLPYREGTFLEHLLQVTQHRHVGVTRVVLGAGAEEIRTIAKLDDSIVVLNSDWQQGQLSSIWAGIRSLAQIETDGILLCPVDHPLGDGKPRQRLDRTVLYE